MIAILAFSFKNTKYTILYTVMLGLLLQEKCGGLGLLFSMNNFSLAFSDECNVSQTVKGFIIAPHTARLMNQLTAYYSIGHCIKNAN